MDNDVYVTINHLEDYLPIINIKVGDSLILRKDKDNIYDDEAIAVYTSDNIKCGYVANSVRSVARGTYSAGRAYNLFEDETNCQVRFLLLDQDCLIAKKLWKSISLNNN